MNEQDLAQVLRSVRAQIAQCRDAPVEQGKAAFGEALVRLVRARNARLAEVGDAHLQRLNALLSLMASIEFPMAGFHRDRMDQVTGALDGIVADLPP